MGQWAVTICGGRWWHPCVALGSAMCVSEPSLSAVAADGTLAWILARQCVSVSRHYLRWPLMAPLRGSWVGNVCQWAITICGAADGTLAWLLGRQCGSVAVIICGGRWWHPCVALPTKGHWTQSLPGLHFLRAGEHCGDDPILISDKIPLAMWNWCVDCRASLGCMEIDLIYRTLLWAASSVLELEL